MSGLEYAVKLHTAESTVVAVEGSCSTAADCAAGGGDGAEVLAHALRKCTRHLVPLGMAILFISNIDRSKCVPYLVFYPTWTAGNDAGG